MKPEHVSPPNLAGAGNGAVALVFQIGRLIHAVPDP